LAHLLRRTAGVTARRTEVGASALARDTGRARRAAHLPTGFLRTADYALAAPTYADCCAGAASRAAPLLPGAALALTIDAKFAGRTTEPVTLDSARLAADEPVRAGSALSGTAKRFAGRGVLAEVLLGETAPRGRFVATDLVRWAARRAARLYAGVAAEEPVLVRRAVVRTAERLARRSVLAERFPRPAARPGRRVTAPLALGAAGRATLLPALGTDALVVLAHLPFGTAGAGSAAADALVRAAERGDRIRARLAFAAADVAGEPCAELPAIGTDALVVLAHLPFGTAEAGSAGANALVRAAEAGEGIRARLALAAANVVPGGPWAELRFRAADAAVGVSARFTGDAAEPIAAVFGLAAAVVSVAELAGLATSLLVQARLLDRAAELLRRPAPHARLSLRAALQLARAHERAALEVLRVRADRPFGAASRATLASRRTVAARHRLRVALHADGAANAPALHLVRRAVAAGAAETLALIAADAELVAGAVAAPLAALLLARAAAAEAEVAAGIRPARRSWAADRRLAGRAVAEDAGHPTGTAI
jgi:hypothetical protein